MSTITRLQQVSWWGGGYNNIMGHAALDPEHIATILEDGHIVLRPYPRDYTTHLIAVPRRPHRDTVAYYLAKLEED